MGGKERGGGREEGKDGGKEGRRDTQTHLPCRLLETKF